MKEFESVQLSEVHCCTCVGGKKCVNCVCARGKVACKNCRNGLNCKNQHNYLNKINETKDDIHNNRDDEGKSDEPKNTENVKGDGNCFFRSISKALFATENKHEQIRKEVVMKMRQEQVFYKEYTGSNFEKHTNDMLNTEGGVEIWATEAEIIGTSECYNLDLFVYSLVGNKPQWLLYTRDGKCNHSRKYVKILHTGSHYKLVLDKGRPCTCGRERDQLADSETTTRGPSLSRQKTSANDGGPQLDKENTKESHSTENHSDSHGGSGKKRNARNVAQQFEMIYNDVIHFKSHNMFMPNPGQAMNNMRKEMTRLINEYVTNSPKKHISLKKLMCLPKLLLQKEHRRSSARENNNALKRRMDAWLDGNFE